jgi:hypothetical protein
MDTLWEAAIEKLPDGEHTVVGVVQVEKNRNEFITAESRERVFFAHCGFHAMGNGGEEFVADGVTVAVVDGFEVVEVETYDGQDAATAVGLRQGMVQPIAEERAIRQTGKQVVLSEPLEGLLVFLLRGDVSEECDVLLCFPGFVAHGRDGERLGEDAAILAAIPDFAGPVAAFD